MGFVSSTRTDRMRPGEGPMGPCLARRIPEADRRLPPGVFHGMRRNTQAGRTRLAVEHGEQTWPRFHAVRAGAPVISWVTRRAASHAVAAEREGAIRDEQSV
jgi:hypothetical protein